MMKPHLPSSVQRPLGATVARQIVLVGGSGRSLFLQLEMDLELPDDWCRCAKSYILLKYRLLSEAQRLVQDAQMSQPKK